MNKHIWSAVIVAIAGGLFFVLVLPEFKAISGVREDIKQRKAILAERQSALQNIKTLDSQYNQRQSDIKKVLTFLPEDKRNDEIISSIQAASIQSGIQLTGLGITPQTQTKSNAYLTTFISVDGIGSYGSLLTFLRELEQYLRLYDIVDLNISHATTAGAGTDALNISIKINTYNLR